MAIEVKAPTYPESVQEGTLATWHKKAGDTVSRDELIVDIETDKVVLEVVASASGTLVETLKDEGDIVLSSELIAKIEEGSVEATAPAADSKSQADNQADSQPASESAEALVNPAAKKLATERGIDLSQVVGSGKGGRITKEDVVNYTPTESKPVAVADKSPSSSDDAMPAGERVERRVAMTRMRSRIAERLLEVTQTTASLTTFNEVDMSAIMSLRKQHQDEFTKTHSGTRLGFMGFFVRASVEALKRFPLVNACLLYTSPSPRDMRRSRMPSSA